MLVAADKRTARPERSAPAGRFAVLGLIVRFTGDRLVARLEKRLGRSIETVSP